MRIAVLDLAARQQPADLGQFVDHGLVGVAFFAVGFENGGATKQRQIIAETAVFHDVVGDHLFQHAQIAVKLELLHAVGGGAVDKAGAFFVGDEVRGAEIAQVVPFAIAALGPGQRVLQAQACQFLGGHIADAGPHAILQPGAGEDICGQLIGKQEPVTH